MSWWPWRRNTPLQDAKQFVDAVLTQKSGGVTCWSFQLGEAVTYAASPDRDGTLIFPKLYHPRLMPESLSLVGVAPTSSPGSELVVDFIKFSGRFEQCIAKQPIITRPSWATPTGSSLHIANHLIFLKPDPENATVRAGRWLDFDMKRFPVDTTDTEATCVEQGVGPSLFNVYKMRTFGAVAVDTAEKKKTKIHSLWLKSDSSSTNPTSDTGVVVPAAPPS